MRDGGTRTAAQVQQATNTAATTDFLGTLLAGSGWRVRRVKRTWSRLDPPHAYWATYAVTLERPLPARRNGTPRDPERKDLTLASRASFAEQDWAAYRDRLAETFAGQACNPLTGLGYPVADDARQVATWFAPVDPELTSLVSATNPRAVARLVAPPRYSAKTPLPQVRVELLRYLPEHSAVMRYHVQDRPRGPERVVFGKLMRGDAAAGMHHAMQQLWELAQSQPELLRVARPVAYHPEWRLHLEEGLPGVPVGSDRTDPRFLAAAVAAAEALAVLHDHPIDTTSTLPLVPEVDRLATVADQLGRVHPPAQALLLDVVRQVRQRMARLPPEQEVVTHGDLKYDQFLDEGGRFALVDFAELGRAETSWDLGKWCGHAVPSMPETWEESQAAEQARDAFLSRYRQLRPQATLHRFPIYEATHLATRAMILMWGQAENWEAAAESLLALAMERLQTRLD